MSERAREDECVNDRPDARHRAGCPDCAAALEAGRVFEAALARRPEDEALGRAAVDRAMAKLDGTIAPARRPRWGRRPVIGFAALAVAAAAAAVFALPRGRRFPPMGEGAAAGPVVLADGSEIAPDRAGAAIQVGEQTASLTTVRLPSGGARFKVRHDSRRQFRVYAGMFEIEDLGTTFHVSHETGGRIRVTVSEGRIAVRCAARGLRVELGAGDDRVLSSAPDRPAPSESPPDMGSATSLPSPPRTAPRARPPVADDATALLGAADAARQSHKPQAAVPLLRRLVERYPADPRAASAAFTLGWVLQTDLNRPRDAALAFGEAERLARHGPLAEDAAARVAEAWRAAGDARRASAAARHYARLYPTGQAIESMRGLAGHR